MHDLTGLQRDALYVAHGLDDPNGQDIADELEDYYGKNIHGGRLYPNLDKLADKGLVQKDALDDRSNRYTVTRRGRREIEVRREWENEYLERGGLFDGNDELLE